MVIARFVNRSEDDFHHAILRALDEKGPAPTTVVAYRAEINDRQLQLIIVYLEERKLITRVPMTMKTRMKLPEKYSLSTKNLISITEKGKKYLRMLEKLNTFIDWNLVIEKNRRKERGGEGGGNQSKNG